MAGSFMAVLLTLKEEHRRRMLQKQGATEDS
jgi:hypothetical protein